MYREISTCLMTAVFADSDKNEFSHRSEHEVELLPMNTGISYRREQEPEVTPQQADSECHRSTVSQSYFTIFDLPKSGCLLP